MVHQCTSWYINVHHVKSRLEFLRTWCTGATKSTKWEHVTDEDPTPLALPSVLFAGKTTLLQQNIDLNLQGFTKITLFGIQLLGEGHIGP